MKALNLDRVEEARDFEKVPAGGYICKITAVEDVPDKEYLRIEYDFADGKFKGHWQELYKSKMFWGGSFIKSYKDKALPFFKAFTTAVENSNPRYFFDDQKEQELVGKLVGLVLGEEEYEGKDGKIKTRLYADQIRSVDVIRKGEFEVPPIKTLAPRKGGTISEVDFEEIDVDDGELPF